MDKIIAFIKKEAVLTAAFFLAFVSCFFVTPDKGYLQYIDFKTICLLFCLMAVMCGFSSAGVFSFSADRLIKRTKTSRGIIGAIVFLCFFFSAVITNDVALITFVPFGITVLSLAGLREKIPLTIVLATVAANMGSTLTPLGNPQNIYLYNISGIGVWEFFITMLPYAVLSFVFILVALLFIKRKPIEYKRENEFKLKKKKGFFFLILFILSLLCVLRIINYIYVTLAVLILLLIFDRKILLKVDYSLLLTFVCFFVFVGNMGRIPLFKETIETLILGNEVVLSAAISQVISNVPAVLLLSGFTNNYRLLLIGVNIGGLGTLIASMASLISYKFLAAEQPDKKGRYLLVFTLLNLILLGICLGLYFIIK